MSNKTGQPSRKPERDGGQISQFLTFEVSREIYGINILRVKEIIDYGSVTQVPMVSGFIAGVINLRGSVVPIIDLALRFSKKPSEKTKRSGIVIVELLSEDKTTEIGVTIDLVNEVVDIPVNEIEPAPSFGTKIRSDFISGMGKTKQGLLVLLDTQAILSIEELSAMECKEVA